MSRAEIAMESSSIEIEVVHCKDLQSFNFFQKLLVYALVSIVSDDPNKKPSTQKHRTPTDEEGDGNPEWNHEIKFDLTDELLANTNDLFVNFELRHEGQYFGDKTIGIVRVPFEDLMEEPLGIIRFVNYQVRDPEGNPNGILNFSFRVNRREKFDSSSSFEAHQISGYPIIDHHDPYNHHHHHPSPAMQYPTYPPQQSYYYPLPSQPPLPPPMAAHTEPPPLAPPLVAPHSQPPPPAHVYHHQHFVPPDVRQWNQGHPPEPYPPTSGYDYPPYGAPGPGFGSPYGSGNWR